MALFQRLNIGPKIAIIPAIGIIGLLVIVGVNYLLRVQVNELTIATKLTHDMALYLAKQFHLESHHLHNPQENLLDQIETNRKRLFVIKKDQHVTLPKLVPTESRDLG